MDGLENVKLVLMLLANLGIHNGSYRVPTSRDQPAARVWLENATFFQHFSPNAPECGGMNRQGLCWMLIEWMFC